MCGRFCHQTLLSLKQKNVYHSNMLIYNLMLVCSNDDPGVTMTYFTARSNLVTWAFLWEKVQTVDFSDTIAACDP